MLSAFAAVTVFAAPKAEWLQTTVDFGAFGEEAGPVTAVFRAVNTGDEPLVVLSARANCGCTTPAYNQEAVAPGDTLKISVTYDPAGRPGRFGKKVYVETNTEPRKSTLNIKGVVIGAPESIVARYPADLGPLRLAHSPVFLGNGRKGHIKSVFEEGYNRSDRPLHPVVRDVPDWLQVTVVHDSIPAGEQGTFNFYVTPDKSPLYGLVTDTVTVIPEVSRPDEAYRVPVVATFNEDFGTLTEKELAKSPAVRVAADVVPLGEVRAGSEVSGAFTVSNDGKSPLLIRRVYSTEPGVTFDAPRSIGVGKKGTVTATLTVPSGPVSVRIQLITNDPANPIQTLRLTAEGK